MKNTKSLIIFLALLLILITPSISLAADPLVPCNTLANPEPCDFTDFMKLINNIIDFIFKFLALPIAAIMFAYAGVLLVTSGGSTESRSKAKSIFTNALIGLALAAGAWLIVKTLLSIIGYRDIGRFF